MPNDPVKNALLDCLNAMENVLCDPEGIPCFQGSDGDRQIIHDAMSKAWDVINNRNLSLEPVSVSLEKCYAAFKTERSLLYMPDGTTVEDIDWKRGIKAVLDAAGVAYV